MHARVVRFEGGDPSRFDEEIAEMRSQIQATRSGGLSEDAPEELRTLTEAVSRFVQLVDRKTGASLGITFCDTEEEMRRADAALDNMSPPAEVGRRTSVEIYEVALDESFR